MQPTNQYPATWHAAEHDQERAWLDDWMRGRICARSLETCPARPSATMPVLTTAGSR